MHYQNINLNTYGPSGINIEARVNNVLPLIYPLDACNLSKLVGLLA